MTIHHIRHAIARQLIDAGLRIMPDGLTKRQLMAILVQWANKTIEEEQEHHNRAH